MKVLVVCVLAACGLLAWGCGDDTACHTESGCESSHGSSGSGGGHGEGGGGDSMLTSSKSAART
jgi:hypothetical protein